MWAEVVPLLQQSSLLMESNSFAGIATAAGGGCRCLWEATALLALLLLLEVDSDAACIAAVPNRLQAENPINLRGIQVHPLSVTASSSFCPQRFPRDRKIAMNEHIEQIKNFPLTDVSSL